MKQKLTIMKDSHNKRQVQYMHLVVGLFDELDQATDFAIKFDGGNYIEVREDEKLLKEIQKIIL